MPTLHYRIGMSCRCRGLQSNHVVMQQGWSHDGLILSTHQHISVRAAFDADCCPQQLYGSLATHCSIADVPCRAVLSRAEPCLAQCCASLNAVPCRLPQTATGPLHWKVGIRQMCAGGQRGQSLYRVGTICTNTHTTPRVHARGACGFVHVHPDRVVKRDAVEATHVHGVVIAAVAAAARIQCRCSNPVQTLHCSLACATKHPYP